MEVKRSYNQQIQEKESRIRKLNTNIKKIHRIYSYEFENMSRNLKDIKIYLESTEKLLKTETKML